MIFRSMIAAALVLGSMGSAHAERTSQQEARQTAAALIAKLDAAYNAHDAAGIASLFAADGVLVPSLPSPKLGAVITGRRNIEQFFSDAFHVFTVETSKVVHAGSAGDNVIWVVSEITLKGRGENGPLTLTGHVGGMLERDGNTWQVRMTTVSARPLSGEPASGSSR